MGRSTRFLAFALTIAATACGGDAIAPRPDAAPDKAKLKITTRRRTATTADITVDARGGTFVLGQHAIHFPRKSICALNSSYGPSEWDKPCTPATQPVDFHVEIVKQDGREWMQFTPEVRFVPTTNPRQYVMLFMWTAWQGSDISEDDLQILWSPAIGIQGIDESLTDPTLRTKLYARSGLLTRRLKHFSAYNVNDRAMACETTDTECVISTALDQ